MSNNNLYETVPYVSEPYAESHPDLLAAIAAGFGLNPHPVDSAKILELGCSGGNNLIPLAAFIPGTQCLGIDSSEKAISAGQKTINELSLANIELRQQRFEDAGDIGRFDYVICHGVYSWIDPKSRIGVLELISRSLAPSGLAYISFNTLPGWYQRLPVRDLMRYHLETSAKVPDVRQEIAEGRLVAAAVAEQTDRRDGIYRQTMNHAASQFTAMPDWYLFHDYLEVENHPVYFSQMTAECRAAGLSFLADVEQNEVSMTEFRKELERIDLATGAAAPRNREQQEQYLDFVINRPFRRGIFVGQSELAAQHQQPVGPLKRKLRHAAVISQRPVVPALARFQAKNGIEITNYLHETIELSPFAAEVVKRLDGTKTIEEVSKSLIAEGAAGAVTEDDIFVEVAETVDLLLSLSVLSV